MLEKTTESTRTESQNLRKTTVVGVVAMPSRYVAYSATGACVYTLFDAQSVSGMYCVNRQPPGFSAARLSDFPIILDTQQRMHGKFPRELEKLWVNKTETYSGLKRGR